LVDLFHKKKGQKAVCQRFGQYLQEAKTISIPDVKPAAVAERKVHTILF
jgi:hypothetical protein